MVFNRLPLVCRSFGRGYYIRRGMLGARCALPEYRRFAGMMICEVQIQTVLDHAWAEMAHDTIYKPMSDVGFGAGAIEAMRKRLRKVMRDYLQPAGYEFQKIASDYERLLDGKTMFDQDALSVIKACSDRNALQEEIERFASHVLPHYDDYIAEAPEIIDTLVDATIRAISMPHVARDTYWGEISGTRSDVVVSQICRLLESGYLRYADPHRMFDAIIRLRASARTDDERKPIDSLTARFAHHDRRAWQHAGPGLQQMIVERTEALGDEEILDAAIPITNMLREALSSTVTGTSWQATSMLMHTGSVAVSPALIAMRQTAIAQLKRLHGLIPEGNERRAIRHALTAAGNTPNNAGYSDILGVVIMNDLSNVVEFFKEIAPELGLEPKRQVETELFRFYHCYHVLPPDMAANPDLTAAQQRLLAEISACRSVIDADEDLTRYRVLVGFDNISRYMWEKVNYDYKETGIERAQDIKALAGTCPSSKHLAQIWRGGNGEQASSGVCF